MGKLSNYTSQEFDYLFSQSFDYDAFSSAKKLSIINIAREWVVDFWNSIDSKEYRFDCFSDADEIFAPTVAGYSSLYDGYLHIKFGAYTGTYSAVSNISGTKIDFDNLVPANDVAVSIDGTLVTYVISLTGATVDGNTILEISDPESANVTRSGPDEITVVTSTSHGEFSVFLKNAKEN